MQGCGKEEGQTQAGWRGPPVGAGTFAGGPQLAQGTWKREPGEQTPHPPAFLPQTCRNTPLAKHIQSTEPINRLLWFRAGTQGRRVQGWEKGQHKWSPEFCRVQCPPTLHSLFYYSFPCWLCSCYNQQFFVLQTRQLVPVSGPLHLLPPPKLFFPYCFVRMMMGHLGLSSLKRISTPNVSPISPSNYILAQYSVLFLCLRE